ncbi:hypothetical protein [Streptomyces shenzhenensis]|uniref:Uncharacterized protein n=1 Tax=Streptomyces sp. R39 TaxID=3238631 RepID=A0AB39QGF9_9ACTN|nr:hypothetical protein [Streptomyces shenzhenensis]
MGTSLTTEFWERFSVLLVLALAMTAILTAVFTALFDALTARLRGRRPHPATPRIPRPRVPHDRPTPVHH